jgi:hypothetical protein
VVSHADKVVGRRYMAPPWEALMHNRWLAVIGMGVGSFVAASGCTIKVDQPSASGPTAAAHTVGTNGGSVATSDSSARVDIPQGALLTDTSITITANNSAAPPWGATEVGMQYTFGPQGLTFAKPIQVTLAFDPKKLPAGTLPSALVVYTAPDGTAQYEALPTTVVDATHVAATTTHFSTDVVAIAAGDAVPGAAEDGGGLAADANASAPGSGTGGSSGVDKGGAPPAYDAGGASSDASAGDDASSSLDAGASPQDACAPRTCADFGFNCGLAGDGCGQLLDCGTCALLEFCGGGGANLCGSGTSADDAAPDAQAD